MKNSKIKKGGVTICGAYGRGNAGDDAILNAILSELRQIDPCLPIRVVSRNPEETRTQYQVDACYTFHFGEVLRSIRQSELYLSGGGSLIQNTTSRRSLYYYLLSIAAAKLCGCRVMMYGSGIGPVYGRLHRWVAGKVIDRCADVITLRDDDSLKELERMGVKRPKLMRTADPTISIETMTEEQTDRLMDRLGIPAEGRYLGLGLREWVRFERAAPEIAKAVQYAWEQYGLTPVFVPIEFPGDCKAARRVIEHLQCPYYLIDERISTEETVSVLARMRLVIGMRLHALIFAAKNGVPCVGISYDMKVDGFLRSIHCEHAILHLYSVTAGMLRAQIDRLIQPAEREQWRRTAKELAREGNKNKEQARAVLRQIASERGEGTAMLSIKEESGTSKRKRIYLTSLHLKHGGVEMVISLLANSLAQQGYEVEILCTYRLGEPVYPLDDRVIVTYLTKDAPNRQQISEALHQKKLGALAREGFRAVKTLYHKHATMKRAIENIQEGAVIATRNEHAILLSKYGSPRLRKIAQLHADHQFDKKLIHDFQTKYQNIDYFVLLTEQTTREIQEFMRGHNDRIQCLTIPNFIERPNIRPVSRKEKQVIAAGRLHADKDFPALLRIWARVVPSHLDWILKIAGEGELEETLRDYAAQLQIAEHVCFTGALEHSILLEEMARSACFALTSVSESFGLVLVESMSCGTPPVSFDIRVGPATIIEDTISGFLVPDRNEELFAEKLMRLMDDEPLREKMSAAALERANVFYRENVLQQWLRLLEGEPEAR